MSYSSSPSGDHASNFAAQTIEHNSAAQSIEHNSAAQNIEHNSAAQNIEHNSAAQTIEHNSVAQTIEPSPIPPIDANIWGHVVKEALRPVINMVDARLFNIEKKVLNIESDVVEVKTFFKDIKKIEGHYKVNDCITQQHQDSPFVDYPSPCLKPRKKLDFDLNLNVNNSEQSPASIKTSPLEVFRTFRFSEVKFSNGIDNLWNSPISTEVKKTLRSGEKNLKAKVDEAIKMTRQSRKRKPIVGEAAVNRENLSIGGPNFKTGITRKTSPPVELDGLFKTPSRHKRIDNEMENEKEKKEEKKIERIFGVVNEFLNHSPTDMPPRPPEGEHRSLYKKYLSKLNDEEKLICDNIYHWESLGSSVYWGKGLQLDLEIKEALAIYPDGWIDSMFIDMYMYHLQWGSNQRRSNKLYLPQMFQNVVEGYHVETGLPPSKGQHDFFEKYTKAFIPRETLHIEEVYFPVYDAEGKHWLLIVINIVKRHVYVGDSLTFDEHKKTVVKNVLAKASIFCHTYDFQAHLFPTNILTFECLYPETKNQPNGHDCGMYVIKYAEASEITDWTEVFFSADEMRVERLRTLARLVTSDSNCPTIKKFWLRKQLLEEQADGKYVRGAV